MKQLKQHVALYGPPAAGKSTIISAAQSAGWSALDLEEVGESYHERRKVLQSYSGSDEKFLFGAADLKPEDFPTDTKLVLLLPSEPVLQARVEERGDERAHKWIEHALKVRAEHEQMAKEHVFNEVIRGDLQPAEILELLEK